MTMTLALLIANARDAAHEIPPAEACKAINRRMCPDRFGR